MKRLCPCCRSTHVRHVFETPAVPVNSCILVEDPAESLEFPKASISLWHCPSCDFVWNATFDDRLVTYDERYEGTQAFSKLFKSYMRDLAEGWLNRFASPPKTILEAGCGQGEFLDVLSDLVDARFTGFDPAYRGDHNGIHVGVLPREAVNENDLVINRMTLEHVADPVAFLMDQKAHLADRGTLISQVPNAERMFRENLACELVYEHVNYFSQASLQAVHLTCGLTAEHFETNFANQHLTCFARHTSVKSSADPELARPDVTGFVRYCEEYPSRWQRWLDFKKSHGQALWVWGAGSRATAFLNWLPAPQSIEGVIDINPNKNRTFVLGTAAKTFLPAELADRKDVTIIVTNPVYLEEIRDLVVGQNTKAEFVDLDMRQLG